MTDGTRRSTGQGSLYRTKTGDRRWRGALILTNPVTGAQTRRFVSGQTKKAATERLDKLRREAETGAFPSGLTTGEFLDRWLIAVAPRIRPATLRGYRQHVKAHWSPALGAIQLTRLTPSDVERAMTGLSAQGLSPATVQRSRSTIRRALGDGMRDGLLVRNSAALARPPRAQKREMRALSPAQVKTLLKATEADEYGQLFALAIGSGLRLGELLGLTWDDIDLDAGLIRVRRSMARDAAGGFSLGETKTRRSRRTVMLTTIARDALVEQGRRQDVEREAAGTAWQDRDRLVFTDAIGRPTNQTSPSRSFRASADALGLKGVRFHDCRHTYASLLINAGVPIEVVSRSLGHSGIQITFDTYGHLRQDTERQAAAGLDRALAE